MGVGNTNKTGSGSSYWNLCDTEGRLIMRDGFVNEITRDITPSLSVKTWAVTADQEWRLDGLHVKYVSSATAGNRVLTLEFLTNASAIIARIMAGAVQAESLTRYYQFGLGLSQMSSFINTDYLTVTLPSGLILPEAYIIKVYDKTAVAAAADTMETTLYLAKRPA
jgi:hypothetical protein